jgi:hypothetical protein
MYTQDSVQIQPLNSEALTLKATMRSDVRCAEPLFAYCVRELKYSFFSGFNDPHSELEPVVDSNKFCSHVHTYEHSI